MFFFTPITYIQCADSSEYTHIRITFNSFHFSTFVSWDNLLQFLLHTFYFYYFIEKNHSIMLDESET